MSVVDTNVLVRYVVADDDAAQARIAADFIERRCSVAAPAVVTSVALAELVWVLRSRYRFAKADVLAVLDALLQNPHLRFDADAEVLAAIEAYREHPVDLADCLIAARASAPNVGAVTFDRKASRLPSFELLVSGT